MSSTISRHKKFTDLFPVPEFLLLSKGGITISDKNIKFAQFKSTSNGLELVHFIDMPLPAGAVSSGYINDTEEVKKALEYLKNLHNLKYVKATLPEERAYVFITQIEKVPPEDLRDAVAFTIEENAPVSLDQSLFDYDIVGSTEGSKLKVAVMVVTYKGTALYTDVFKSAGLIPISFETESQVIARAIVPKGDERAQLIINLFEDKTGLYIVENEIVHFTSTVPFGTRMSEGTYRDIHDLKSEIRKIFAFWNTRLGADGVPEKKIEHILFVGEEAGRDDFISQITEDISVDYSLANVWVNALSLDKSIPTIPFKKSLGCAAAVGLSLPRKSNFYV